MKAKSGRFLVRGKFQFFPYYRSVPLQVFLAKFLKNKEFIFLEGVGYFSISDFDGPLFPIFRSFEEELGISFASFEGHPQWIVFYQTPHFSRID